MNFSRLALVVLCGVVTVSTQVYAQVNGAVTHGVSLPVERITDMDSARALEVNPAALGFVDGFDVRLQYTEQMTGSADGFGLFGAMALFGPFRLGADFQYLREGILKGGIGLAWSPSRMLSIAGSWHGFGGDDRTVSDLHTFDVGAIVRPTDWLSVAAVVHDLGSPEVGGREIPRAYDVGVAFRPGTWRFGFGFEAQIAENNGDVDLIGHILTTPVDGLRLGFGATVTPRGDDITTAFSALLGVDWSLLSVETGAYVSLNHDNVAEFGGFSTSLGITETPRLSIHRPDNVWVRLTLGSFPEPPQGGFLGPGRPTQLGLVRYLERLVADPHIGGVVFRLDGYSPSWAQAQEVRKLLGELRAAGKKVVVWFDQVDTKAYYTVSEADRIVIDPAGGMWLVGLSSSVLFYEELLSKIGIEAQFVRFGRYKSYPESFTERTASKEVEEVRNSVLDALYSEVIRGIGHGRKKTAEQVMSLMDEGPYTSAMAVDAGLCDKAVFADELSDVVAEIAGEKVALLDRYIPEDEGWEMWGELPRIAVITVSGSIVDGESFEVPFLGDRYVGAKTVIGMLEQAEKDPLVKAIVLRIDSPGGSAVGSDHMHRKIQKLQAVKPVVVSMGGVAASGGYYIAAPAKRIFAESGTITGSIGIFTGKFSAAGLFAWLGIHQDLWKRGKNADLFAVDRPWTPEQVMLLTNRLEFYYNAFLKVVADGRKMTVQQVDAVAQGRVWVGSQAVEHNLVDEIGGLDAAIHFAQKEGGLDPSAPFRLVHLPKRSWLDSLKDALIPKLPILTEVGAPWDEPASDEPDTMSLETWAALAPVIRHKIGGLSALLPYGAGEPLFLVPYTIDVR